MPKPRPRYRLFNQDCLEVVSELEPKSIDTVICDPPYGLNFMGKQWDHGVPGMLFWARIRKVCKPGALLLAFGGTRTYHRLACAIEDGGWQIRDCMLWMYGQGFPKSLDIGKATEDVEQWKGYGSSLKPSWEPILVCMKPFRGTFVDNALAYAVAGFNIDAGRIAGKVPQTTQGVNKSGSGYKIAKKKQNSQLVSGRWPANLILSHHLECVQVGTKKVKSNERPNCEGKVYATSSPQPMNRARGKKESRTQHDAKRADADGLETVEAWECHEDCPVRMLDLQSIAGGMHGAGKARQGQFGGDYEASSYDMSGSREMGRFGDTGGASRFFYTAKASRRERELYLKGYVPCGECGGLNTELHLDSKGREVRCTRNIHATIKPLAIMEYLCRLTRPPSGGVVFDPFMGSGTTGVACANTKRKFIGCEIDTEHGYFEIARRRIKKAYSIPKLPTNPKVTRR